jgi:hypothetical protein
MANYQIEKTVKRTFTLYPEDIEIIDKYSKLSNISKSEFLRIVLNDYKSDHIESFVTGKLTAKEWDKKIKRG